MGLGFRIRDTLRDIDPLTKVPFKRATSRVQNGPPLRGLPNPTWRMLSSETFVHPPQLEVHSGRSLEPDATQRNRIRGCIL